MSGVGRGRRVMNPFLQRSGHRKDPSSAVDGHVRAWLVATWLVRGLPSA
jgi:hypothetical protein